MVILIAESKTMTPCDIKVPHGEFLLHRPLFDSLADNIMSGLRDKPLVEIADAVGISISLAQRMKAMIYEFPNKSLGRKAIAAYTGVVFNSLRFDSLSEQAKELCRKNVRIISSLYGWLKPDDIIKSYRTEFKSEIAPLSQPLWKYYRLHNSIALGKYLRENHTTEILDLLPSDAAKSIDWKTIKRFAGVYKADFLELTPEGDKTPHAGKLKKLRGELLRDILNKEIVNITDLLNLEGENYICENHISTSGHIRFITA